MKVKSTPSPRPKTGDGTCKNSIQIEFQVGREWGNIKLLENRGGIRIQGTAVWLCIKKLARIFY